MNLSLIHIFNYELPCRVARRVPRTYYRDGKFLFSTNYMYSSCLLYTSDVYKRQIFHRGDIVTECAHSNVSIFKDGKVITHQLDDKVLPVSYTHLDVYKRQHLFTICLTLIKSMSLCKILTL